MQREFAERRGAACPRILGIDEHFFSRKAGYATTFCDLRGHTIFDVVLGRSEAALEDYLAKLPGKDRGLLSLMRRHRHNLKPGQKAKLEAYFEQFPVLREI